MSVSKGISFNVLDEPCVPVKFLHKADVVDVSIHAVFEFAHEIEGIYANSAMEEYGIKRVLVAMFMDMYRPATNNDLKALLSVGHFDVAVLANYVFTCQKKGNVFDLFDADMPFLQLKHMDISKLGSKEFPERDFSSLWWDVINESKSTIKGNVQPCDIFKALCAYNVFLANKNGEGYPPNINGSAPYYCWLKGRNLFEEFVLNAVSIEDWYTSINKNGSVVVFPYGDEGVCDSTHWTTTNVPLTNKQLTELYKKKQITSNQKGIPVYGQRPVYYDAVANKIDGYASISLLEGLTYQGKGFLVKPVVDNNGSIIDYKLYYQAVYKFSNQYAMWRDPYCIYKTTQKKDNPSVTFSLKPNEDNLMWVNVLEELYSNAGVTGERPLILQKFGEFALKDVNLKREVKNWGLNPNLNIIVYAAKAEGAKYFWMKSEAVALNSDIFESLRTQDSFKLGISAIGLVAKSYRTATGIKDAVFDYRLLDLSSYYIKARKELETNFALNLINGGVLPDVLNEFKFKLLDFADACFEASFKQFATSRKYTKPNGAIGTYYAAYYDEKQHLRNIVKKKLDL